MDANLKAFQKELRQKGSAANITQELVYKAILFLEARNSVLFFFLPVVGFFSLFF